MKNELSKTAQKNKNLDFVTLKNLQTSVQFSSAHGGLTAFAEVFPVPTFGDVRLHTVGAFETAKVASLSEDSHTPN